MGWLILLALMLLFPKVFISIFVFIVGILWVAILGIIYVMVCALEYLSKLVQ